MPASASAPATSRASGTERSSFASPNRRSRSASRWCSPRWAEPHPGLRAAISHTGSLAGEDRVFAGIARQFGIVRARNEEHMLDLVEVFTFCDAPAGNGIGIVTQSGGAGVTWLIAPKSWA